MKITLELVRQTLRETLGQDSFVAGFITSVQADSGCPTAGITKEGQLSYNPSFIDEFVTTKEDLFSLVFHELLHPMFNHFIHQSGELENIAADAIINAVISSIYPDQSKNGHLFRKIYKPKGVTGLLRSGSRMDQSRLDKVYDRLYFRSDDNRKLSTGELITTLKVLLDHQAVSGVLLVGTHGNGQAGAESFSQETLERIAYDIKRSATRSNSRSAGHSSCVIDLLMEALHTHLSIRRVILEGFATNRDHPDLQKLFGFAQEALHTEKHRPVFPDEEAPEPITTEPDSLLAYFLKALTPQSMADEILLPIDQARAAYSVGSVRVESYDEFCEAVFSFYAHLLRHLGQIKGTVNSRLLVPDALDLLERAFADHGGIKAAYEESRSATKGGLRCIFDRMTDRLKMEERQKYIRMVFKTMVGPLDYEMKVALMKAFFRRLGSSLPEDIRNRPPEQYATDYELVVKAYADSLEKMIDTLNTL